jgi:SAM-dependent methyltransferase
VPSNDAERQRWNDAYWTSAWPRRERLTSLVTDLLVDRLAPAPGERILDVGSGGGTATLAIAARVASGRVIGADISEALVALATRRASESPGLNVSFTLTDVQCDEIDGAPFDAVASQFGVMFFDDPVRAFANIRAHVVPGGRFVFACWRSIQENPWALGPRLAPFVDPPAAPEPGASPTGPFALADSAATRLLLESAGWSHVEREVHDVVTVVERDIIVDDEYLVFVGVRPTDLDEVRRVVADHLAHLTRDDGRLDARLAFQLFTAINGSV